MRSKEELEKIAKSLLPIEKLFFKHGKGWMIDRINYLTKEEYEKLKEIVKE